MLYTSSLFGQQLDYKKLESSIQAVVKKVARATVAVSAYDTIKNRKSGLTFSAVVVSADGYILTAAHAASPHQIYQVHFSDGRKVLAAGLGNNTTTDASIIKIMQPGNWPYAEMGSSANLEPYHPCISMGYPQNLKQSGHPLVRFGYIVESDIYPGFFCNTALMEPGDSGGPLFDLDGRVIGIHSRIAQSLDANFEVPVDAFRNNWANLLVPKTYYAPESKNIQKPAANTIRPIPELEDLPGQFSKELISKITPAALSITSEINGEEANALGTLMGLPHKNHKDKSYIISKSSIVGNDSIRISYKNYSYPAVAITRDSLNDLVLLEVAASVSDGIYITTSSVNDELYSKTGKFLLSPGTNYGNNRISILSSPAVGLIPAGWRTFLGIMAEQDHEHLIIKNIEPFSPAASSKLKIGDRIKSIDGIKVKSGEEIDWVISIRQPSTVIRLKGKRNGLGYTQKIKLAQEAFTQPNALHIAEQFEGGKSLRKDGFRMAFIHDARLYPSECGGPVFDSEGNFMGINIARVSRTSSVAIPASEVDRFIRAALKP